jgi:hypothetical protein
MGKNPLAPLVYGMLGVLALFMVIYVGYRMLDTIEHTVSPSPAVHQIAEDGRNTLGIVWNFPDPSDMLMILGIVVFALGVFVGYNIYNASPR